MSQTKANILIVDDRPEKLLALEAVLEDLHQTIILANSGREALRHVLNQDFAVILLDVNMPGMDGFETASLIRQRSNSRHTPIIFITAFGDEMHAAQGYSLGAVDYILAPVLPEVLRTKVAVFVELFSKTEQIKRQAESLHRRASQMQRLAAASLAINSALSINKMLETITDTARDIVGADQAFTLYLVEKPKETAPKTLAVTGFSDKYTAWRDRQLPLDVIAGTQLFQNRPATRMTETKFSRHPDGDIIRQTDLPPIRGGILAAPLTGRNGRNLGVIYLSDPQNGEFSDDDESILVQLAQLGSIAIENTVYAQERQANRIKDEFLATLSHELRTPLNAILGWTQLLKMGTNDSETSHGLEVIERNARAQTKLIEDLLDVSRITTGKMQLNLTRANMIPIIQAAADAARPAAAAKEISINLDLPGEEISALVDIDRIQQVVWNLLSNAIKFTPPSGRISIRLEQQPSPESSLLALQITDTGQGIDPEFLPYVFDRFRQADSTSTRSHGGLGIGLAIVRHIVEQHGGTVGAASDGLGHGATFTIQLPLANPAGVSVPAVISPSSVAEGFERLDAIRVLLVDDEADAREVIATTLRRAGAVVASADSAAKALDSLESFQPDVLLSDIAMPDQDGYALIQQVRERFPADSAGLPAIALTAYAREEDRAGALAAGFQAHLAKPVDPAELVRRIAQWATRVDTKSVALKLAEQ